MQLILYFYIINTQLLEVIMKTKLEMAHEWAIKNMFKDEYSNMTAGEFAKKSFDYADAMQAEADKRLTGDTHKEEWQPDWSKAPLWAEWWAMDEDGDCYWFEKNPTLKSVCWMSIDCSDTDLAPSFEYQDEWRDSLRKRPK